MLSRAEQLSGGIQALISECVDLEALVSSPSTRSSQLAPKQGHTLRALQIQESNRQFEDTQYERGVDAERNTGAKIKVSKMARRQQKMMEEGMDILRRCAMQCWARAAMPSKIRGELLGRGHGEKRGRSLTCP